MEGTALAPAFGYQLPFDGWSFAQVNLAGNVTFTTSGLRSGRELSLIIPADRPFLHNQHLTTAGVFGSNSASVPGNTLADAGQVKGKFEEEKIEAIILGEVGFKILKPLRHTNSQKCWFSTSTTACGLSSVSAKRFLAKLRKASPCVRSSLGSLIPSSAAASLARHGSMVLGMFIREPVASNLPLTQTMESFLSRHAAVHCSSL